MSKYKNYKEVAMDLSLDVKAAHARINQLEAALEKANKMLFQLRGSYMPRDEDGVLCCSKCGEELGEENAYCHHCGVKIQWTWPEPDDGYDALRERRLENGTL